jgi:hypothetical protein
MQKFILILGCSICFACSNSSSEGTPSRSDSVRTKTSFTWTKDDEHQFLSDCIEHAKNQHGEDTAYIYCNCVLQQVKEDYPNLDSASAILIDSVQAAKYTDRCQ